MPFVFLRQSNGSLSSDAGKGAPTHLLKEIGESAYLDGEGRACWKGVFFDRHRVTLGPFFAVVDDRGRELNEHDAWEIVFRKAIVPIIKEAPGKALSARDVLARANQAAAEFFRLPKRPFRLVTSLSVADLPEGEIACRDATVIPLASREPGYPLPEVLASGRHGERFASHHKTTSYRHVAVAVEAATVNQAADEALDALALLRGYWSLFATYGRMSWHLGMPQKRALGAIHSGPVSTLHEADGTPARQDLYWHDPDHTEDRELFKGGDAWPRIERLRVWAMGQVAGHGYRADLERLLARYAAALDCLDHNTAFLKLWSILEAATATDGSYEQTINRAVWLLKDEDRHFHKNVLESLRLRRNQFVHADVAGDAAEQVSQLMKTFVETHLLALVRNDFGVASMAEYAEFLSLPRSLDALVAKRAKIDRAIRVLSGPVEDKEGKGQGDGGPGDKPPEKA